MSHAVPIQGRRSPFGGCSGARVSVLISGLVLATGCGRIELGSRRSAMAGADGGAAGGAANGPVDAGPGGPASGAVPEAGSDAADSPDAARPARGEAPSCSATSAVCGVNDESCCLAPAVAGGAVALPFDAAGEVTVAASVSSFRLDKYEVSVARFRAFIADYDEWRRLGNPRPGAGAHPRAAGSGWRSELDAGLPALGAELERAVR